MSDVGSDVEDFEGRRPGKRARAAEPQATAPQPVVAEDEDEKAHEAARGEAPVPVSQRPPNVLEAAHLAAHKMFVKSLSVKEMCNIISGCCSVPNMEAVMLTFSPQGLEFYGKPAAKGPVIVQAFYHKNNFSEYRVVRQIQYLIPKYELEDLKKHISKDVEAIEFTTHSNGFVVAGRRKYKNGGACDFQINLSNLDGIEYSVSDMSELRWNLQVRTASMHFSQNVNFFDDSIKHIQLVIKEDKLEFYGYNSFGVKSRHINQMLSSKFQGEHKAIFNKKMLKSVVGARDINKTLCISFNVTEQSFPVHFMYEMGQEQPQSHLSIYLLPMVADET